MAASVAAAGAGRTLALDAEPPEIRAAAQELLATPAYHEAALRLADAMTEQDGASLGADELEDLLSVKRPEVAKS